MSPEVVKPRSGLKLELKGIKRLHQSIAFILHQLLSYLTVPMITAMSALLTPLEDRNDNLYHPVISE